jgi:polysaccharide export outer membrane protein
MRKYFEPLVGTLVVGGLVLVSLPRPQLSAQYRQEPRTTSQPQDLSPTETSSEVHSFARETTLPTDYVIGPEDVVEIDVFNVPELGKTVRVANDGTISLPLIGRVKAAGFTPTELSKELEAEWGENYLQDPQVTVFVREFHAQPVSIVGAVEKPGLYQLVGPRTLIEMLSMAGGLAKRSSAPAGRTVYVTRKGGFANLQPAEGMNLVAPDKVEIDLRRLLYSHEDALNIEIKPLDIVAVSKADIVYVTGRGVQRPGGFVLEDRDNVTVFQALAMAEGLSANAAKHDARIIRQKVDGSRLEIPVDLDKVLKGKAPDPVLAANDILFVPDSLQKAGLKRALESTVQTISGVLIFRR